MSQYDDNRYQEESADNTDDDIAEKLSMINRQKSGEHFYDLVTDLINIFSNAGKRWSDSTTTLFTIILDYGGKAAAKELTNALHGPSSSTLYKTARLNFTLPIILEDRAFIYASSFFEIHNYKGPFILAIKATVVVPASCVKKTTEEIIKFT